MTALWAWPLWKLLRLLGWCIRIWPLSWIQRFGRGLGRIIQFFGFRRKIIESNLALAYPGQEELQEEIKNEHYQNLGILVLELLRNNVLSRDRIAKDVVFHGLENLREAQSQGKGVLLLGAHFCNWEIGLKAFATKTKFYLTSKKMSVPWVQWSVERQRSEYGMDIIYSGAGAMSSLKQLVRASKEEACILYVLDQHTLGTAGVRVNFFGVPAATSTGLAHVALKTGMPVVPVHLVRKENGQVDIFYQKSLPLLKSPAGDRDEEIFLNTQLYSKVLEDMVRLVPSQWLWIHRRWKANREPLEGHPEKRVIELAAQMRSSL